MNSRVLSLLAFLSLVTLALCLAPSRASAQAVGPPDAAVGGAAASVGSVPRLIKFSGQINPQIAQITPIKENESAKNQSTTLATVSFSLYELQEGGSPLWSESQNLRVDDQGRYSVLLGATQPDGLPLDLFTSGKALWLGVQRRLPGAVEQPRVLLVAVPYALKASDSDTLGGKPASAYALAGSQTLLTPSTVPGSSSSSSAAQSGNPASSGAQTAPQPGAACSSVTSDGTATAASIAMFTTNCNLEASAITQTSGNIGISGASPAGTKFQITDTPPADFGIHYTNHEVLNSSVTKNGTNKGLTFVMDATNTTIPAGVTDSGYRVGVLGAAYASTTGFAGTLGTQYGVWGRAGINAATSGATVTNAFAGYFDIFNGVAGTTITNAYGVYIANTGTTGTIANRYDLYASSANGKSYFAGKVGIGTKTPAASLEVNGTTHFDGAVTFAGGGVETLTGDLSLPQTTGAGVGVIDLGGSPFIQACCPKSTRNTFVGANAGNFTADASGSGGGLGLNTAIGYGALEALTSGRGNTASGYEALYSNTAGLINTASGYKALILNTTGEDNTASGGYALYSDMTGSNNTAVGFKAGTNSALTSPTTGSNSTFVGAYANATVDGLTNATAIGYNALVGESNALVLGGTAGNAVQVGIGTATPQFTLDVQGTGNFTGLVTFAAGQTFPGTGTVTSVGSGAGLTGGPITTSGTLSIATAGVTNAMLLNPSLTVTAGSGLSGGGSVSLGGSTTVNLASVSCPAGQAAVTLPLACQPFASLGANSFTGNQSVKGDLSMTDSAVGDTAITALAADVSAANTGISGAANGAGGTGVLGDAENGSAAIGVWGMSASGYAGEFTGDLDVTGAITAGTKDFKIDDPTDPANKYMYHASVESSQMMNIYSGNVTLDGKGEATVEVPAWLETLNGDFRYQLTCIGGFAPVYVAEEIGHGQFKVAGGKPGMRVSWLVTGVRQDAFARAHPLQVEVEKPENERGYYVHPELYGAGQEKSIQWARHPEQMRKMAEQQAKAVEN
ncbi:MAG: beta strand repeat-containing protein [Terriglobia bacterium]